MTIPYDVIWILVALVVIFIGTFCVSDWDGLYNALIVTLFVSFALFGFRSCSGFTAEDRARISAQDAEDNKPYTSKTPMADGCFLYYHYANGRRQNFTTKYVKCENAAVTTEKSYSCGTSKAPKTCTEYVTTQDVKK